MSDIKKQKLFLNKIINNKKALKNEKKAISLYKELVQNRFFEVLSNANPIFFSLIEEKVFIKLINEFIKSGAKTELIWQIPNEFRSFIKNQKKLIQKMPYINDLLWFEWIELKLFMQDYSKLKIEKFKFKNKYNLSKSTRIKKLKYKIYNKEFKTSGKYFVLTYYDLKQQEVKYREISDFMYEFLKLLDKNKLIQAISIMTKRYKLEIKELKNILKKPLIELCSLGVLVKKD